MEQRNLCPPLDNGCTDKNGTTEEGKLCLRLEFNGYKNNRKNGTTEEGKLCPPLEFNGCDRKNGAMEQRNLCPPLDISLLHNNHVNMHYTV